MFRSDGESTICSGGVGADMIPELFDPYHATEGGEGMEALKKVLRAITPLSLEQLQTSFCTEAACKYQKGNGKGRRD